MDTISAPLAKPAPNEPILQGQHTARTLYRSPLQALETRLAEPCSMLV